MTRRSPIFRNARDDRRRAERRAARAESSGSPLEAAAALRAARDPRQLAFDEGFWFVDRMAERGGGSWDVAFVYLANGEGLEALKRHAEARTALEFLDGMASWLTYNDFGLKQARRDREKFLRLRQPTPLDAADLLGRKDGAFAWPKAFDAVVSAANRNRWAAQEPAGDRAKVSAYFESTKSGVPSKGSRHEFDDAAIRVEFSLWEEAEIVAVVWVDPSTREPRDPPRLLQALESPGLVFHEPRSVVRHKILSFAQDSPSTNFTISERVSWVDAARPWLEPEILRASPATHATVDAALEEAILLGLSTPGADAVEGGIVRLREKVREAGSFFRADPHLWIPALPSWPDRDDDRRVGVRLHRAWDRVLVEVEKDDRRQREVVARTWTSLDP